MWHCGWLGLGIFEGKACNNMCHPYGWFGSAAHGTCVCWPCPCLPAAPTPLPSSRTPTTALPVCHPTLLHFTHLPSPFPFSPTTPVSPSYLASLMLFLADFNPSLLCNIYAYGREGGREQVGVGGLLSSPPLCMEVVFYACCHGRRILTPSFHSACLPAYHLPSMPSVCRNRQESLAWEEEAGQGAGGGSSRTRRTGAVEGAGQGGRGGGGLSPGGCPGLCYPAALLSCCLLLPPPAIMHFTYHPCH